MPEVIFSEAGAIQEIDFDEYQARKEQQQPQPDELDYRLLYESSQQELRTAQSLLEATRAVSASPVSHQDAKPNVTFTALHAKLGWHGINSLTPQALATAIGLEAPPDDATVLRFFGNGADVRDANQLMKADPRRYRMIREFGRARRLI